MRCFEDPSVNVELVAFFVATFFFVAFFLAGFFFAAFFFAACFCVDFDRGCAICVVAE
jgi:hypothetical protein